MRQRWTTCLIGLLLVLETSGCRSTPESSNAEPAKVLSNPSAEIKQTAYEQLDTQENASEHDRSQNTELLPLPTADSSDIWSDKQLNGQPSQVLLLNEVVVSVRNHFPLIRQAMAARGIAAGQALSASGAFDHKLEAFTESQPLGFYENYRNSLSIKRDTMWGGQTFAGYRAGRGVFEPWYLERETNKGGEFKAGFLAPLVRDRWIDSNRAELWQAQLERRRVEPEIMAQVILFVRNGSIAYWNWVVAGENYKIVEELLKIAERRNEALSAQVEAQEKAEIDLVDNQRIIVSREAKLIEARRKLEQAAVKLSLFLRSEIGEPLLAEPTQLPPKFSEIDPSEDEISVPGPEDEDTNLALAQRPELAELQLVRQQLRVALRQAQNETRPDVDGGFLVSQDVGEPTSTKRDKSELELEALITVNVPLERRKALGKVRSLRGKIAQLRAKYQFASDKIVAEIRLARAALIAARERVGKANESFQLAIQMQQAEQELFNQGQSTLFNLNIREQQAAEAASSSIQALLEYFVAWADYDAARGLEVPTVANSF